MGLVTDGPAPRSSRGGGEASAGGARHAAATALSSVSGLGTRQYDQSTAGEATFPSGAATSGAYVTGAPGRASAGSAFIASTRAPRTIVSSDATSGTQAAARIAASQGASRLMGFTASLARRSRPAPAAP